MSTGLELNNTRRTPPSNGLADLVDRDSTALVAERATSDISPLETRKTCVTLPRARKLRQRTEGAAGFDDDDVVEVDSVWYVRGDSFLAADEVRAGQNGRSRLW